MKNTLKNKAEIDNLFMNGKTISDRLIMLKWVDSTETKFLFAVSSKKFKRAVDRNRVKRLMREVASKLSIKGKIIAIILRGDTIPTFKEMSNSINKLADGFK